MSDQQSSDQSITLANTSSGSFTISDPDSAQTIEISSWTQEETEHFRQSGETPLARLHRENLEAQWGSVNRPTEQ